MIELRQSTAGQEVPLGYFLDSTDGDTEETGLTVANTDIKIWKWGATTLANKNSGGATHISNGIMYCVLDATDSNTLGPMIIFVHVAGALTVRLECSVLTANVWDSKYSSDKLQVDITQCGGSAVAAGAIPNAAADAAGGLPISDTGGLDLDAIATNAARLTAVRAAVLTDWINDGRLDVLLDAIPTTAMRGTDGAALATVCTEGRLAELAAANLPTDIDTLLSRITAAVALASVCTEARLAELAAANIPADLTAIAGFIDAEITAIIAALVTAQDDLDKLTGADGATLATAQANYAPSKAGDEMNLADDAITAGKFDESSAHPVTAAMQKAGSTIVTGTVSHDNTPATTTVFYCDDITEATADHFNGRIIIFTSGPLLNQATDITDYALKAGEGKFTVTALTEAPGDNVTFVIV